MSKIRIIAIANQKGGVAKTTSALALGTALADRGQRVLLVDLDPQGSLTNAVGVPPHTLTTTLYTAMTAYLADRDAFTLDPYLHALQPRRDLVPTNIGLARAEVDLQHAVRREYVLAEMLAATVTPHDVVLIDCPPSLSLLTINALTAATAVIIPVVPEYLAAYGLGLLMESIAEVRKSKLNATLHIAGVLLTMVDSRTLHGRETAEAVRAHLAGRVPLLGEIKRSIKAAEAAAHGLSITDYAAESDVARAYGDVAAALLASWGVTEMPRPVEEATHA